VFATVVVAVPAVAVPVAAVARGQHDLARIRPDQCRHLRARGLHRGLGGAAHGVLGAVGVREILLPPGAHGGEHARVGGRGGVVGPIIAVVILQQVRTIMTFLGVNPNLATVAQGFILIAVVMAGGLFAMRRRST